jgi:alpha-tubulin suppressor-like RCC1 family protein
LYGFGKNLYGEIGDGSNVTCYFPKLITKKIQLISAGYEFSLITNFNSSIFAFGKNDDGQLGIGSYLHVKIPTELVSIKNYKFIKIFAGVANSLAIDCNGIK